MNVSTLYGPNVANKKVASSLNQEIADSIDNVSSKSIRPEQWSPWKSFGKLMNDAILEMGWQERYSILRDVVIKYGKVKSGHLTMQEFLEILNDNPITEERYRSIFYNLMDRNQDGIVSEIEFTSGMLSLSPLATNDPKTSIGQLRLQFIFLYYDTDRNGILNLNELKRMLLHISAIRSLAKKATSMSESKAREYAIHLIAHYDGVFGFNAFYNSVRNNILKGTGWLLRTHLDLVDFINNDHLNQEFNTSINKRDQKELDYQNFFSTFRSNLQETNNSYLPIETKQVSKKVFQQMNETLNNTSSISNAFNKHKKKYSNGIASDLIGVLDIMQHNTLSSSIRLDQRVIEYYMSLSLNLDMNNSELEERMYINNILNHLEIMELCDKVVEVIRNENSLIKLPGTSSALRIFGSIYGQLIDILHFFENFSWPHFHRGDILSMNYVFLGDYVDRGKFSLEVVCLLFSLKIMFPNKIFLLRGNHEDASINCSYGFLSECNRKFGINGEVLWERINDVFEFLSLGVINDQILCLHSGIGKSIKSLRHLSDIPKPIHISSEKLLYFDTQNSVNNNIGNDRYILDCLWSEITEPNNAAENSDNIFDCIEATDVECVNEINKNHNKKCYYDLFDLEDFMNNTDINLIVRTSEHCRNGYEYNANGRILTLTSITNFCNRYKNDAAAVVITRDINHNLLQFNQILKFQSFDNSFGWIDQNLEAFLSRNLEAIEKNTLKKKNTDTNFNDDNYSKGVVDNNTSFNSPGILNTSIFGRTPNSIKSNNYSASPKSSAKLGNIDENPITPTKIKNLCGRPVNLTAF